MSNIIDKIQLSGVTYTIGGGGGGTGGTAVEEMTQAQYDAAASAGTLDDETLYIITDAEEINANEYVTKAQNNFSGYTHITSMDSSYNYLYTNRTDIRTVYLSGTSSNNDGYLVLCLPNSSCEEYIGGFNFDGTVPTNTYCDITYDSVNKIYTISIKDTYPTDYISYFYFYEINDGRIWFVDTSVSSGQSAAVLNEFVPNVYDELDKKPNKSDTVKVDSLSVSKSNSTQWYLYYTDNAGNGRSTSFEVCDGDGIVMGGDSTKLSLKEISTVSAYTKEWITSDCKNNICGNNETTYNDAAKSIVATFNSSLAEYNQFYFVVCYNSQGSVNSLEWYITKREGTIYISGAYLSDETSDFSTLNSEISANTGLNIEFSQSGLTYTKGTSNDPFICELYCNYCLDTNDTTSLFSSVITTQNKIGMYNAVNTLFGNYETGSTGGGKAVSAGTNISVTTGETADTINCTLPIVMKNSNMRINSTKEFANSLANCFTFGGFNTVGNGASCSYLVTFGSDNDMSADGSNRRYRYAFGNFLKTQNSGEIAFSKYNVSNSASTTFGDSGNTLFSVGNGTSTSARHNAFEIRQNGDIYLSYNGNDIKLQDLIADIYSKLPTS